MIRIVSLVCVLVLGLNTLFSQVDVRDSCLKNILRVNVVNPGIELEQQLSKNGVISYNVGYGYGVSYPELSAAPNGFLYMFSPFGDIQYKYLYNRTKRMQKGKSISDNQGNFLGVRCLVRGEATHSNFSRTSNIDYAIGPIWGYQTTYKKFSFIFNCGSSFYFDNYGNSGILPFVFELSLGFNVWKK